jgi:DNA/RNA-binding domain of Phe-tRNA-synthetase-like protein
MNIRIDEALFQAFPGYVRHVVLVEGIDNSRGAEELPELEALLREAEAAARTDASYEDLKTHPRLASWREAFQAFHVNPNKCPPSIFNLIKRVRSGASLPFINPLVCIFNVVSLHHCIPAGGDDLDKVMGDIRLGYAVGTESYVPLGQPDVRETPNRGEVILVDSGNQDVFCRAWCWRNGHPSRIEPSTRRVAINVDALPPVDLETGRAAAEEVAALVTRFCNGQVQIHRLEAGQPSCVAG